MVRISYSLHQSPFGELIMASTEVGVCYISFFDTKDAALADLERHFPGALLELQVVKLHEDLLGEWFKHGFIASPEVFDLQGTEFQRAVWSRLLQLQPGERSTYGDIATAIGRPKAYRAVGTAIGRNLVALLIPCHRITQRSGKIGGYRWGIPRKDALLSWESQTFNS